MHFLTPNPNFEAQKVVLRHRILVLSVLPSYYCAENGLTEKKLANKCQNLCFFSIFCLFDWSFEALSEVAPNFAVPHIFCVGSGNKKMQARYWKSWDFLRFLKISEKSNEKVELFWQKTWILPQSISLRIKIYFFPRNHIYFLDWEVLTFKKSQI